MRFSTIFLLLILVISSTSYALDSDEDQQKIITKPRNQRPEILASHSPVDSFINNGILSWEHSIDRDNPDHGFSKKSWTLPMTKGASSRGQPCSIEGVAR